MTSRTAASTTFPPPSHDIADMYVRKASMADIPGLLGLINSHAEQGIMLPRTEFEMAENLRDFSVIGLKGRLAGCGALHLYTSRAGEIRSLVIATEFQGCGAGRILVETLEQEAQAFGLADVFAFTYIPGFFEKLGFTLIDRSALPLKAWKDCLRCPKFQCCDEIAVIKHLTPTPMGVMNTHISGGTSLPHTDGNSDVLLPVLRNNC